MPQDKPCISRWNKGVPNPKGGILISSLVMTSNIKIWIDIQGTEIVPQKDLLHLTDDQWGWGRGGGGGYSLNVNEILL